MYMGKNKIFRAWAICLMMLASIGTGYAQKPAGTTADRATAISDTTELTVQSGSNFVRLTYDHLPATILYRPKVAYGAIPEALYANNPIAGQRIFTNCEAAWKWELTASTESKIVEIRAHEDAIIEVQPVVCPADEDTTATAWDSFKWRGDLLTASGDYPKVLPGPYSCEYTITLHLTIHHTTYETIPVTACGSYTVGEKTYEESCVVKDTTAIGEGDRKITTYELTINQPTKGDTTAAECVSFTWYGKEYKTSGEYTHMLKNKAGCDSTLTLHLTINQPTEGDTTVVACSSFTWYDKEYKATGEYTHHLTNKAGCDSTLTLHLTINQPTEGDTTATACSSFTWYGKEYKTSGEYTHHLTNKAGCDSTLTLHLTINQPTARDTTAVECSSFTWYGTEYKTSGTYTHHLTNKAGCDSTITLYLTINQPTTSDTTAAECGSFMWYGTEYKTSGTYEHVFPKGSKNGCDSTVILHLKVSRPTAGEETVTRCLSYTSPQGNTYTESGVYTEMTKNAAGCDSTITIHLTLIGDCTKYDTIYFCQGVNTPHDERVSEELVRRYVPYRYEAPNQPALLEGVLIEMRPDSTLMDLGRAESNLRAYYTGELVPVERVTWSARYRGATEYVIVEVQNQPQWVAAGQIAVQVQFLCGEVYNNAFSTEDIEGVQSTGHSVQKALWNGQVVIIRGGEKYTVTGLKIEK